MEKRIYWVCYSCGHRHGRNRIGNTHFHRGHCDICGETTEVTESKDFGIHYYDSNKETLADA